MKHRTLACTAVTAVFLMTLSPAANAAPSPRTFTTRDTSSLPVVYLSGANDVALLNSDVKKNITAAGMQFFEWDPLKTSLKESPTLYDHMDAYAESVDAFVKSVLKKTGAKKVNIITYSQSGLINQSWMKNHGGAQYCLGFGTCVDFDPWGPVVTRLNENGEALAGIIYYNLTSKYDEMAMPYQINFMYSPTGNYKNVLLQDYYPAERAGHLMVPHAKSTKTLTIQMLKGLPLTALLKK